MSPWLEVKIEVLDIYSKEKLFVFYRSPHESGEYLFPIRASFRRKPTRWLFELYSVQDLAFRPISSGFH